MPQTRTPVMVSLSIGSEFRFSKCWSITRTDNVVFRFTDHDQVLVVDGLSFTPADGMDSSAIQYTDTTEPDNFKAKGIISSSEITQEDLDAGLFRGAEVIEYVVDNRFAFAGTFSIMKFTLGSINHNAETKQWEADCLGLLNKFSQHRGSRISRSCEFVLYDADSCGVVKSNFTNTLILSAVASGYAFTGIPSANDEEDFYEDGTMEWTVGNNTGFVSAIKSFDPDTNEWVLQIPPPYTVQVGDQADVSAGCNRLSGVNRDGSEDLTGHCKHKFSNLPNFGGFFALPTNDELFKTPELK